MLWNSGLIHMWCCSCAVRALPGPGSILAASQSCSRALWTTTRLGQASAGASCLLWGAVTCHWNMDCSTVVVTNPLLCALQAGRQGTHSNTGISAQTMYPERAGPGRDMGWGSWTSWAETPWFVLLPSRSPSLGLCRRWAPSSPLTCGAGRAQALLIFSESNLHPHGTTSRMGLGSGRERHSSARNSNNINHLWPSPPHQGPQNTITAHGWTKSCCPGWVLAVWPLHPLNPPASLVLPGLLSSSAERSWAPQKLLKSRKPDD